MKRNLVVIVLLLVGSILYAKPQKQNAEHENMNREQFLYYFYEAHRAYEAKEYDRALALFLFAEQLAPNDAAVQHSLGNMFYGLQNTAISLAHYERAYALNPTAYWEEYVSFLYQAKDYPKAASILQKLLKQQPDNVDLIDVLTNVYIQMHQYKKALRLQNTLVQKEGVNMYNTMTRYRLWLYLGKTEEAIHIIEDYLEKEREDYRMQTFLGDIYLSTNQMDKAIAIYEEEAIRHPDNPYNWLSIAKWHNAQGNAEQSADAVLKAIMCEGLDINEKLQILQNQSDTKLPLDQTINTLLTLREYYPLEESVLQVLGKTYMQAKRYSDAFITARELSTLHPDNVGAWDLQLECLQADTTSTDSLFAEVIQGAYHTFPNHPKWCYYMASVLLVEDNIDSAIVISKEGLKPSNYENRLSYQQALRIRIADMYSAQENLDSAYHYYEEALRFDPENIYTLNNYSYLLATHGGDLKRAEKMSQKTIQAEPDNATYLDTYAWILHLQGVESLAKFYIQKAKDNITDPQQEKEIIDHYNIIYKL